jgi:hypothetical protein
MGEQIGVNVADGLERVEECVSRGIPWAEVRFVWLYVCSVIPWEASRCRPQPQNPFLTGTAVVAVVVVVDDTRRWTNDTDSNYRRVLLLILSVFVSKCEALRVAP